MSQPQYRDLWDRIDRNAASSASDLFDFLSSAGKSRPLSSGEQVMYRVLMDLLNGTGHAELGDILRVLDDDNFAAVMLAVLNTRRVQVPAVA